MSLDWSPNSTKFPFFLTQLFPTWYSLISRAVEPSRTPGWVFFPMFPGFHPSLQSLPSIRHPPKVDDLLDAFGELCDQLPLAAVVDDTCGCVRIWGWNLGFALRYRRKPRGGWFFWTHLLVGLIPHCLWMEFMVYTIPFTPFPRKFPAKSSLLDQRFFFVVLRVQELSFLILLGFASHLISGERCTFYHRVIYENTIFGVIKRRQHLLRWFFQPSTFERISQCPSYKPL